MIKKVIFTFGVRWPFTNCTMIQWTCRKQSNPYFYGPKYRSSDARSAPEIFVLNQRTGISKYRYKHSDASRDQKKSPNKKKCCPSFFPTMSPTFLNFLKLLHHLSQDCKTFPNRFFALRNSIKWWIFLLPRYLQNDLYPRSRYFRIVLFPWQLNPKWNLF